MDCTTSLAIEAMPTIDTPRAMGLGRNRLHWVTHSITDGRSLPKGRYATLLLGADLPRPKAVAQAVSRALQWLLPAKAQGKVLIVGLGNPQYTADALGCATVHRLHPTPHRALFCPNVQQETGIATMDMVRGMAQVTSVNLLLAIDTMACAAPGHLCRTIQLSDAGITPGGGLRQSDKCLCADTMGIPVLYIGVPLISHTDQGKQWMVSPTHIDTLIPLLAQGLADGIARVL